MDASKLVKDDEHEKKAKIAESIKLAEHMVFLAETKKQLPIDPTKLDPNPASLDGKWI